jgi:RNA polymerase sigma-70 factor (ECF subfamily)
LDSFLGGVERRALIMAELATRDREEALDLVQDSMLSFVSSYGRKPPEEWAPLFHRVLQNRIRDWHRRMRVRRLWQVCLPWHDAEGEEMPDPIAALPDPRSPTPERRLQLDNTGDALLQALSELPLRQRQAFLLRTWEGLDVADTARAMGCSEGSVKTHLFRAMAKLRERLQAHWS